MSPTKLAAFLLPLALIRCAPEDPASHQSAGLYLPADLEATLWAESPLLFNPTNMDTDLRGRIWVTEAVNYRNFNNDSTQFPHHPQGDRVVILEDTDLDGKADTSKVFVQDTALVSPLGIAVFGNKVVVSCSPNLLIYTDDDGDDRADRREILLTGFGGLDHDHSLHSVTAGPDGQWYFNTGNAGPHHVTDRSGWQLRSGSIYTGGTPYNDKNEGNQRSDDGKTWVGGLALRVQPDGKGLGVLAHNFRNSYEVIVDGFGDLWQSDNDDQVVACRNSWLMEGGNAGYFSTDGSRFWNADQRPGQPVPLAHWHQDDPGTMPCGDLYGAGSPTGMALNEGDGLGKKYRGMLFAAEAGRNLVFSYQPKISGAGFDLGERQQFVASSQTDLPGYVWDDSLVNRQQERWFRPSDVLIGTDGALFVADWYDPVVGGHQMQDSTCQGRIYRIAPKGKKPAPPRLDPSTPEGLVEIFSNPAVNVRSSGFEGLRAMGEKAVPFVKSLLKSKNPWLCARAVWLLSTLGEAGKNETEKLLTHKNERLRATAFRALRQASSGGFQPAETALLSLCEKMVAADPTPFLQREVAIALRDVSFDKKQSLLLRLLDRFDGQDRWLLETLGTALEGSEDAIFPALLAKFAAGKSPLEWDEKMSNLAWRLHPVSAVPAFALRANAAQLPENERRKALVALGFIRSKAAAEAMFALSKSPLPDVREQAVYWLAFRQSNDWFDLLDWNTAGIDPARERRLAEMKVRRQKVLDESMPPNERKWNAYDMAKDSVGGSMLVALMAEKRLPDVVRDKVAEAIFDNPDPAVRLAADRFFGATSEGKAFSIAKILQRKPDLPKGKLLFEKKCAPCHRFGEAGMQVGPDLTFIGQKLEQRALLDAVINPNAGVVFGFEPWVIHTKDGGGYLGFLLGENEKTLTIRDLAGKLHVVPVEKIASRQQQKESLMPGPAALGLSEEDLGDLVGYLLKR